MAARFTLSEQIKELLASDSMPSIVAGDLNAHSWLPEVDVLENFMHSAYAEAPGAPKHCGGGPIDYLFFRGPYRAAYYNTPCGDLVWPSDHPFVVATLWRDPDGPPVGPPTNQRRQINVSAALMIKDDDSPWDPEINFVSESRKISLDENNIRGQIAFEGRAGDEVRAEVNTYFTALPHGGVLVDSLTKLFEGESDDSTDLDGKEGDHAIVHINELPKTLTLQYLVQNEDEGGDEALINLTVVISPLP